MRTRMRRAVVVMAALTLVAVPAAATAQTGLGGPVFGMATAPNGDLLVADLEVGIVSLDDGVIGKTIDLPGVTDVSPIGRSSMWATTTGQDPQSDSGQALYRVSKGQARMIVNLFEFEAAQNPDGNDPFDSNPFDVQSLGGNAALVVDAGGNDLLRVNNRGNVHVLAVFPDELVSTANLKDLVGCAGEPVPDLAFFCGLPEQIPAQAVPTSVAIGPDGYYYVGELKGFPGPTDASNIWKVSPDADWATCPSEDCVKVFSGGFTSIIDLAFGPDGDLYVAELDEQSWAAVEIFQTGVGGTINACDVSTLSCDEVASELPILTAITFGKDGALWATINALVPGAVDVIQVS